MGESSSARNPSRSAIFYGKRETEGHDAQGEAFALQERKGTLLEPRQEGVCLGGLALADQMMPTLRSAARKQSAAKFRRKSALHPLMFSSAA